MTYGSDVFDKEVGYDHPIHGCATEEMNTDEKCYALLKLINQLEWRIEELENNS